MTVRCALVVPVDAEVDDELLGAVAEATGKEFARYGGGGSGTEVLATLYSDAVGDLLIEAKSVAVGVRAVLVRTAEPQDAVAVRQVVGDRLHGWSEQMIRVRVEAEPDGDPQLLAALAMAAGGGPVQQGSVDLLKRAARRRTRNKHVRDMAGYALRVAADLAEPPIVRKEQQQELAEVLRAREPAAGGENWVTARPGVGGRQIPRPVSWLRGPDAEATFSDGGWDGNWLVEVAGDTRADWREEIWLTEDGGTAMHMIEHPALDGVHIAVHGRDTTAVVATRCAAGDLDRGPRRRSGGPGPHGSGLLTAGTDGRRPARRGV